MAGFESEADKLERALENGLRRTILRMLGEDGVYCCAEVAARTKESMPRIAYHMAVLAQAEAVGVVEERNLRGVLQRFYERTIVAQWALAVLEETAGEHPSERDGGRDR